MFRSLAVALMIARVALAVPSAGPELPVDTTLGQERINAFHFGLRLDALADRWVLSWTDNRGEVGGSWLAIYDADGGVLVPGNRALADAYDFSAHGQRAMCQLSNGSLVWVLREAYTSRISVITTSPDGVRLTRESYDAPGLTVDQALTCPGDVPLWLTARYSTTPGQYALEVRQVALDAGATMPVDGGSVRETLRVTDREFSYGFSTGTPTAWWTEGGAEGLDLYTAAVSVDGVGPSTRLAGGVGHQTSASVVGTEAVWTEQLVDAGQRDIRTSFRAAPLAATPQDEDLPQLVFDGNEYLAAWRVRLAPYDYELRVAAIASNGTYGTPSTVHRGWFDELHLASLGGGSTLVVFRDFSRNIHAVSYLLDGTVPRATPDGGPIDPGITAFSQTRNLATPVRAGTQLLSWEQDGQRLFRLLGGADAGLGQLDLKATDVRLASNGAQLVAVGFGGQAQVVDATTLQPGFPFTWSPNPASAVSTPAWDGTRFRFLSVEGSASALALQSFTPARVVSPPEPIATDAEDGELALGANGTMVIAWSRTRELHLTCRDAAGNFRELLSVSAAYLPLPRVASSGEASLVVFLDDTSSGIRLDGFLVDRDCTVARRLAIGATDWWSRLDTYVSTVEWDGAEFIVAWLPTTDDVNGDLAITAIDEAGAMRGPFLIAAQPGAPELEPSLAVEGPGRWWVSYQRFDAQESVSTRRAFYRLVVDDAGVRVDAGVVANDGGAVFDAGTMDPDAGALQPDAGVLLPDGGTPPTPHRTLVVSCGCSSGTEAWLVGLIALSWRGRRRYRSPTFEPAE